MIGPGPGARVMVPTRPVDFRKGPDALAALERFPQLLNRRGFLFG
jgi:hypothetical protein